MKERILKVLRWVAFPAFYLLCLALFGYWSFPYNRLKDRAIAEFEKHAKPGQRLEIGKLGAYWFSGVEVSAVKLHMPAGEEAPAGMAGMGGLPHPASDDAAPKETVITIDEAHVRVRMLPLLIGRVQVDFWASTLGGEIRGTTPVGNSKGDVELEVEHVDVSKIDALSQGIGVPVKGMASGTLTLSAPDGKLAKANGSLDLKLQGVVVSDGKTKIQGYIELPAAKIGDLTISADVKDGALKFTKLENAKAGAAGLDLEIAGDGKITLRDPWQSAIADLYVRFKFTDAYRVKSDMTKTLLGEPGGKVPGLIEKAPKMSQAKRTDGFYGFHAHGTLTKLRFDPSPVDTGGTTTSTVAPKRPRIGGDAPIGGKRPGFPLGVSTAASPEPSPAPAAAPPPAAAAPEPPARQPVPEPARPVIPPPAVPEVPPAPVPVPPPAPAPQPEAPPAEQPAPEAPAPEAPAP